MKFNQTMTEIRRNNWLLMRKQENAKFIDVKYIDSSLPLGTQDGQSYRAVPVPMPEPDFTEKH